MDADTVKKHIVSGKYTCRKPVKKGRVGEFYRVMQDIYTENDTILKRFYYCLVCAEVMECKPGAGTGPLNRHANNCDPKNDQPSTTVGNVPPAESSGIFTTSSFFFHSLSQILLRSDHSSVIVCKNISPNFDRL